jgi:hypothetical protein
MGDLLSRAVYQEPFQPMIIRLLGGFELPVSHPELVAYMPGVPTVSVFDAKGYADTFNVNRIVSIRRFGGPA